MNLWPVARNMLRLRRHLHADVGKRSVALPSTCNVAASNHINIWGVGSMPVLPDQDYQRMGLDELLALVDADRLVREWHAAGLLQSTLPRFADRSGGAAA